MLSKPVKEGYAIRFKLPEECGHSGYWVRCIYRYDKKKEKYALQMKLFREDIGDECNVDTQEIDARYVVGTRETIEDNIRVLIEYGALSNFFEKYIKKYEYTYKCFDYGNSFYENEILIQKDE